MILCPIEVTEISHRCAGCTNEAVNKALDQGAVGCFEPTLSPGRRPIFRRHSVTHDICAQLPSEEVEWELFYAVFEEINTVSPRNVIRHLRG